MIGVFTSLLFIVGTFPQPFFNEMNYLGSDCMEYRNKYNLSGFISSAGCSGRTFGHVKDTSYFSARERLECFLLVHAIKSACSIDLHVGKEDLKGNWSSDTFCNHSFDIYEQLKLPESEASDAFQWTSLLKKTMTNNAGCTNLCVLLNEINPSCAIGLSLLDMAGKEKEHHKRPAFVDPTNVGDGSKIGISPPVEKEVSPKEDKSPLPATDNSNPIPGKQTESERNTSSNLGASVVSESTRNSVSGKTTESESNGHSLPGKVEEPESDTNSKPDKVVEPESDTNSKQGKVSEPERNTNFKPGKVTEPVKKEKETSAQLTTSDETKDPTILENPNMEEPNGPQDDNFLSEYPQKEVPHVYDNDLGDGEMPSPVKADLTEHDEILRGKPPFADDSEDSNFFTYFIVMTGLCGVCYLAFHNKNKILALAIEGRKGRSARARGGRHSSTNYSKLHSNLEEAIVSNSASPSVTHVPY